MIFVTKNKIGFLRFAESAVGQFYCDAGNNELVTATLDNNHVGIIYAGTSNGDILIFEALNALIRPEAAECRLIGKVSTNLL